MNCHNRRHLKHTILKGVHDWRQVSSTLRHVLKIGDIKFFECPVSAITPRTWARIKLINETARGEHMENLYLPNPGTIQDQPPWYREALRIVQHERAEHRAREMKKMKEERP